MLNRVFQMAKRRQQIGQFLKTRASKSGIFISSRTRRERAREGESKSSEVRPKLQLPYKSAKATIRKGLRRKYTKVPVLMFLCFTRCFTRCFYALLKRVHRARVARRDRISIHPRKREVQNCTLRDCNSIENKKARGKQISTYPITVYVPMEIPYTYRVMKKQSWRA